MKKLLLITLFAAAAVVLLESLREERAIRYLVTGSSTVAPVLQAISESIHDEGAGWIIEVQTGGSGRGIADIRAGECNMGMASRELSAEESAGISVHAFAFDGVALIAAASNECAGLTHEQVVGIYTGKLQNWNEVGGGDLEIEVINKAEGRATLTVFLEHFGLKNSEVSADAVIGDNAQGIRLVANNPKAVGYVSIGEALSAIQRGEKIKLLALDGVLPSLQSVRDGSFPLRRSLSVLFAREMSSMDQSVLGYLHSEAGLAVIEGFGFVPAASTH